MDKAHAGQRTGGHGRRQRTPNAFDELLAGRTRSSEDFSQVLMVEHPDDLVLHEMIQRTDIGDHPGDLVNRPMDGDETVPLAALIAFLHGRKRIAPRHVGNILTALRRHIGIQIFVFIQPDGMERADVFVMSNLVQSTRARFSEVGMRSWK